MSNRIILTKTPHKDDICTGTPLVEKTKVATIYTACRGKPYVFISPIRSVSIEFVSSRGRVKEKLELKSMTPESAKLAVTQKKGNFDDSFWIHITYAGGWWGNSQSIFFPAHRRGLDIIVAERIELDDEVLVGGARMVVLHATDDINTCDLHIIQQDEVLIERNVEVVYKDSSRPDGRSIIN